MYIRKDKYFNKAKQEGYRGRAAYKLLQIQKKYNIIKPKSNVLDIGCAPGAWLQVAKKLTSGFILGVDIVSIEPLEGIEFIKGDILEEETQNKITQPFDVVLSDIAPKTTGIKKLDQEISYDLSLMSLEVAKQHLKKSGNFIVKTFQGNQTNELVKEAKKYFELVKIHTPEATREGSKEVYIIALKKK